MARKKNDISGCHGDNSPTDHYLNYFNQFLPPVQGRFLNENWNRFSPTEQRLITYLNESYPSWLRYVSSRINIEPKQTKTTFLQNFSISTQHNFDSFLRFLLEDLSDEEDLEEGVVILKKLNNQEAVENPNMTSLHIQGLRKGIDIVLSQMKPEGIDKFEAACYFFTLAFCYLSEPGNEYEYYNAMFEAAELLGEFRGWCSNVQELELALKKHENAKNAGFAKAEKSFGQHKIEVMRILKEEILKNPGSVNVKTATALHDVLGQRLNMFIAEHHLTKSVDSARMIKGWAREGEFRKLFNEVLASCKYVAIKK
jgi:hypothetical protein